MSIINPKIGDIVYVRRFLKPEEAGFIKGYCETPAFYSIVGIVIKTYDNGRFYIKCIKDDLPENKKKSWARYGIKNGGYFVDQGNPRTVAEIVKNACVIKEVYDTSHCSITKRTISSPDFGPVIHQVEKNTKSRILVFRYDAVRSGYCPEDSFTFVLLENHQVGGFASGISDDSRALAAYIAKLKHYETIMQGLESYELI